MKRLANKKNESLLGIRDPIPVLRSIDFRRCLISKRQLELI